MPSYKVLESGFYGGRMYAPDGKRPVLHTDKPFPSKDGKEQIPKWVERIGEKSVQQQALTNNDVQSVKELKAELTELGVEFKGNASKATLTELLESHKKTQQDRQDIAEASFMGEGEQASSTVETL